MPDDPYNSPNTTTAKLLACSRSAAPRILLIQDCRAIAGLIRFRLLQCGFEVDVETTTAAAIDRLAESTYDMLVVEQSIQQSRSDKLLTQVRCHQPDGVPILLTSSLSDLVEAAELQEEFDIWEVVVRPFSPHAVAESVQERLGLVDEFDVQRQ